MQVRMTRGRGLHFCVGWINSWLCGSGGWGKVTYLMVVPDLESLSLLSYVKHFLM